MSTPNDANPNYDNYGKGDWNRSTNRKKLRDGIEQVDFYCNTCGNTGHVRTRGGKKPCPVCKPHVTKISKKHSRTTYKYG